MQLAFIVIMQRIVGAGLHNSFVPSHSTSAYIDPPWLHSKKPKNNPLFVTSDQELIDNLNAVQKMWQLAQALPFPVEPVKKPKKRTYKNKKETKKGGKKVTTTKGKPVKKAAKK